MKCLCFLLPLYLMGCNVDSQGELRRFKEYKVKATEWDKLGLPQGQSSLYDTLTGKLYCTTFFVNGIKNGVTCYYNEKGVVVDSSEYYFGLRNGYTFYFDSIGNLYSKNYFLNGLSFGPEFFYSEGKLYYYGFRNFNGSNPFSCEYDSVENSKIKIEGKPYYVNTYVLEENKIGVIAFFARPPKLNYRYYLSRGKMEGNEIIDICEFDESKHYLDTIIDTKMNYKYYIKAHLIDSLSKSNELTYVLLK